MEPREALPGTTVRVSDDTRRTEFRGMEGTIERSFGNADHPALDVRLAGLEERSPTRIVLSRHSGLEPGPCIFETGQGSATPGQARGDGVIVIQSPQQIASLPGDHLLIEGGAQRLGLVRRELADELRAPEA